MGAAKPTYLVQMQNDWMAKATALQSNYATAEANTLTLRRAASENRSLEAAATQAALAEQAAAKAYNDFLKTGSVAYKVAQDIDSTLNGPRNLSTLERHQLQVEKRNLEAAWEAFNDFTQTNGLRPIHVPPVYAGNRVHYVDGTQQWDTSTRIGQLGSIWDAGKAALPHVVQAATQTAANQYTQCVGALDGLIGGFAGKLLPGHAPWGQMTGELWEQHVGKAFTSAGSEAVCRLVYPQHNAPTAVGSVTGGQVALVDGQIIFRPDPHHHGEASFSYTVRNSWGLSSTGTAQLRIDAVNDAPVAQADSLATDEDRVLWLDAAGLLANDSDVDDDRATLRIGARAATCCRRPARTTRHHLHQRRLTALMLPKPTKAMPEEWIG